MRPIDADAALKALRKCQPYLYDARDQELKIKLSSAKAAINNLPTIQPEKEQLSCGGTTSDTISRQAAIDALNKQIQQCRKALGSLSLSDVDKHAVEVKMASLRAYRGMLENLPTIEPEPQEGHWIDKGWDGDWAWQIDGRGNCWRVIECSKCGKRVLVESNYCPHCGERMKGERQK